MLKLRLSYPWPLIGNARIAVNIYTIFWADSDAHRGGQ